MLLVQGLFENRWIRDFSGGLLIKNLPSDTRDSGSAPGQRTEIPHAKRQRSPCTAAAEPEPHSQREALMSQ